MKFSQHEEVAKEQGLGKSQFWKPEKGMNKIRILSGFEVYKFHWLQKEKRGGICIGKDDGCEFCKIGDKGSVKFLLWILDRKDGEVKPAQFGYSIVKQIGELAKSEDWGFDERPEYDITIKKTGESLETEYFVSPTPNKALLSAEEQAKADATIKPLKEIINRMKEKAGGKPGEIQADNLPSEEEVKVDEIPF